MDLSTDSSFSLPPRFSRRLPALAKLSSTNERVDQSKAKQFVKPRVAEQADEECSSIKLTLGYLKFKSGLSASFAPMFRLLSKSARFSAAARRLRVLKAWRSFGSKDQSAEVVCVGSEILIGDIQETNSRFIARQLPLVGMELVHTHQVSLTQDICVEQGGVQVQDDEEHIAATVREAMQRSATVFIIGGLGPTVDDITREAVAKALNEPLTLDETLLKQLEEFYRSRKYRMNVNNRKQAELIPSAVALHNELGTAPGWECTHSDTTLFVLPGPPAEFEGMFNSLVFPRLKQRALEQRALERGQATCVVQRTLKTSGMGESSIDHALRSLVFANPTLGIYAKNDGVHVRLTAVGEDEAACTALLAPKEKHVRGLLGDSVWGVDEEELHDAVLNLLRDNDLTLACCEGFTGGLLSDTLTASQHCSSVFKGSLVLPASSVRLPTLPVPQPVKSKFGRLFSKFSTSTSQHGVEHDSSAGLHAESERKEEEMTEEEVVAWTELHAEYARHFFQTDIGVATSLVRENTEVPSAVPVGTTHVSVSLSTRALRGLRGATAEAVECGDVLTHSYLFAQTKETMKARAVTDSLTFLRKVVLGEGAFRQPSFGWLYSTE